MTEYEGFSVHGLEIPDWGDNDPPFQTGYGLALCPSEVFDDDYGNSKRGVYSWTTGDGSDRNELNNGGQNLAGVGGLMYDKYIEESAAAIGCPQADFTEVTPFTDQCWGALPSQNYQYVKEIMGYPRLDPDKSYGGGGVADPNTDPNAYWRNDFYVGESDDYRSWGNKRYVSSYIVRGPMFRGGSMRTTF